MKNKIFHQIVRYEYAKCAVNSMRHQKKHTILEVGAGSHGNLALYLPDDEITFLDLEFSDEILSDPRFVIGDATNLNYVNNSFDFVIALDVIEHIPIENREKFINSINRVAKMSVILSAPHFSSQSPYEDDLLKTFYKLCGSEPPVWIDEHIDCLLPTQNAILNLIRKQGIREENILIFCGVKRSLMLKMLIMEAISTKYPDISNYFNTVNSDYTNSIMYNDILLPEEEAMKTYSIWTKGINVDIVEKKLKETFISSPDKINDFEYKYTKLTDWALSLEGMYQSSQIFDQINFNSNVLTAFELQGNRLENFIKNWTSKIDNKLSKFFTIKLNVVLITYNHSAFIRQTLQTILDQQTYFDFNIIVADDCSTDDTITIIQEMEQQTDIAFVYLENDHNLGIMQNYKRAFSKCDAEFIAIMEGDDLWTDKHRLQKHVDFLESHTECAMSFNRYIVKNFEEGKVATQPRFSGPEEMQYYKYISGHDLAYNNLIGNFSTSVYRSSALKTLPEQMYSLKCYDWLTNIMVSKTGYIGCLMQPMSIYRIHSNGVWSGQSEKEQLKSMIEAIDAYDLFTDKEFTAGFSAHKSRLIAIMNYSEQPPKNSNKSKKLLIQIFKEIYHISSYVPPIFISIIKLLIPKALMQKILRNI